VTDVLVVGAGSAGARHAKLLEARGANVAISDPDHARAESAGIGRALRWDDANLRSFPAVVVASPNNAHFGQAMTALSSGAHVLIEKPMALTRVEADELVRTGRERTMVAYNLRLHEPIERTMELIAQGTVGRPLTARFWFGSYLPDWRPGSDYRVTYSARSELGGGVLLDAIHELDLVMWLLGGEMPVVAGSTTTRVSGLEIDVEDVAMAILRARDGLVVDVSLDYLSRRYRRGIEVIGEGATIRLDWARQVIEIEDASGVFSQAATTPVAESYARQAERFLAWVEHGTAPPVDGVAGAASVALAEEIKATACA
jgi:predicted dehydrogenase